VPEDKDTTLLRNVVKVTTNNTTTHSMETLHSATTLSEPQTLHSATTLSEPQTLYSATTLSEPQTLYSATKLSEPQTLYSATTLSEPQTFRRCLWFVSVFPRSIGFYVKLERNFPDTYFFF
jgi:hypothetical protein